MAGRIVVVGSLNMDLVVEAPRRPGPGETLMGTACHLLPGGKGANQAAAVGRLGGEVTMVGRVGADPFGARLTAGLQAAGVDVAAVGTDPDAPTGVAVIVVEPDGENSIIIVAGANGQVTQERLAGPLKSLLDGAAVLLLQLEIPLPAVEYAAAAARKAGVTVILDPAPAARLSRRLLASIDILTPNTGELLQLAAPPESRNGAGAAPATPEAQGPATRHDGSDAPREAELVVAARRLLERGVGAVVVTMGPGGALLVHAGRAQRHRGFPVEAVDTTAAGDAFAGALAVALAGGDSLVAALPFANAAGALACTRLGAQPSLPGREAVLDLVAER